MNYSNPPSMSPHSFEDTIKARDAGRILEYSLMIPCNCNLDCKYCFTDHEKEKENVGRRQTTFEDIQDFILQGVALGLEEVQIVGSGEPTMYPHFWELLEFIKKEVGYVTVFTNSLNNSMELSKQLAEMRVNIVTKLNGMQSETNDFLTGVASSYSILRKAIDNFLEAGYTKNGLKLAIHTALCKQNYDEIPEFWRFCRDRNIIPYVQNLVPPLNKNNKYYQALFVDSKKVGDLYKRILEIDQKEYGFTWTITPPVIASNCQKSRNGVGINTYGDVCFCAYSNITHGNLFEERLKVILQKESVQKVRHVRELSTGKCGKCNHPFCQGGCRAIANITTGDILGDDTFCWLS